MSKKLEPCPNFNKTGHDGCLNRHQCWEPCGELGHSEKHARPAPKETQDAVNSALGLPVSTKGAQQESVDLVQKYINSLERRIGAAKNALVNGNQAGLALDILDGKRGY